MTIDPSVDAAQASRRCIEEYPHPAMVALLGLDLRDPLQAQGWPGPREDQYRVGPRPERIYESVFRAFEHADLLPQNA